MARTKTLRADRLILEPFAARHLTRRYVRWLNDPAVTFYSRQRERHHNLNSCREYVNNHLRAGNFLWAIVAPSGLGHIGNIAAYIDKANSVADLAIVIGERTAWGQGYGREAWIAACRWLLGPAKIRKITGGTTATNKGMRTIMREAGMVPDGIRRRQWMEDGRAVDIVYGALFRKP